MKIEELARLVGGAVEGDGTIDITGLGGIDSAKPGDLTFAMDEEKLAQAEKSSASCILTAESSRTSDKPLIRVKNPKLSFLIIYNTLSPREKRGSFVHPTAVVAPSAKLGTDVWIGPHVTVEENVAIAEGVIIESSCAVKKGCSIGPLSRLYPNVTLYERTLLGKNVILHSGSVIGADGFGYVKEAGRIYKFPQLGRVIIEDDVEIGANTTIDRGSLNDTVIGAGTKIDNLCQVAHNVKLGRNVILASQTGIAGSTVVENDVTMGGQVGVGENLTIGEGATIGAKSGVSRKVGKGLTVWGIPAREIHHAKKQKAVLGWLTKHFDTLAKSMKLEASGLDEHQ